MVRQAGQSKPIRIGIADKSPLMRAALKQLISEDERFEMVSASEDSEAFLKTLEPTPIDVAIVGWRTTLPSCPLSFLAPDRIGDD